MIKAASLVLLVLLAACTSSQISDLGEVARKECDSRPWGNNVSCDKYIYMPVYDLNDELLWYTFTFYDKDTPKPDINSRRNLYLKVKLLEAERIELEKNAHTMTSKEYNEKWRKIVDDTKNAEDELNGNFDFVTETFRPDGTFVSGGDHLPEYFGYDYLELAKSELKSEEVSIEKVYAADLWSHIIKYKSDEGRTVYLLKRPWGGTGSISLYNQEQFNAWKKNPH